MSKVDKYDVAEYGKLISYGLSQREACTVLGIPRSTMQEALKRISLDDIDEDDIKRSTRERKDSPRILFLDVENAPSIVAAFSRFNVNFGQDNVVEEGGWMITACYKWAHENYIHKLALTQEEIFDRDDSSIVAGLYEAIENADIVVAQNGDRFDMPLIRTRGLLNGFPPFKAVKTVDTLKIARSLKFNSNRLDSLGAQLGLGRKKQHTGIDLWLRCMDGDEDAIQEMLEYNEQDVALLEAVYYKLRSFDTRHPNLANYYDDDAYRCPVCGSTDVEHSGHKVHTAVSEFLEMVCGDCGSRSRQRKTVNTKEKRASLLLGVK